MTELNLELDRKASETVHALMDHFKINSKTELFSKALAFLKIAAYVDQTQGELFARKGTHETKIIVR